MKKRFEYRFLVMVNNISPKVILTVVRCSDEHGVAPQETTDVSGSPDNSGSRDRAIGDFVLPSRHLSPLRNDSTRLSPYPRNMLLPNTLLDISLVPKVLLRIRSSIFSQRVLDKCDKFFINSFRDFNKALYLGKSHVKIFIS